MATRTTTVTVYGLSEAARMLGLSRWTLHRAIQDGKLVAHVSPRRTLIFAEDLLEYVLKYRGGRGIPAA